MPCYSLSLAVPPYGSPAFAEDDDLRRRFHFCHPTSAILTALLSPYPRYFRYSIVILLLVSRISLGFCRLYNG